MLSLSIALLVFALRLANATSLSNTWEFALASRNRPGENVNGTFDGNVYCRHRGSADGWSPVCGSGFSLQAASAVCSSWGMSAPQSLEASPRDVLDNKVALISALPSILVRCPSAGPECVLSRGACPDHTAAYLRCERGVQGSHSAIGQLKSRSVQPKYIGSDMWGASRQLDSTYSPAVRFGLARTAAWRSGNAVPTGGRIGVLVSKPTGASGSTPY